MGIQGVATPSAIEQQRWLIHTPWIRDAVAIAGFVVQRSRIDVVPLSSANPPLFGEHNRHRVRGEQVFLTKCLRLTTLYQRRASLIPKLLCGLLNLFFDQVTHEFVRAQ